MEITIHLPSGDELQSELRAVHALLQLRITEPRFIRLMQVMCGLMCAEDAPELLLVAVTNEVRVLEEHAVRHQMPLGAPAQAHVALFWYLHDRRIEQELEEQDRELRSRYREHGLHAMHLAPQAVVESDDDDAGGCLVCCAPVRAPGFTACSHGDRVCGQCTARLDRCPLCRTALWAARSPAPAAEPTSARSAASAPTGSP